MFQNYAGMCSEVKGFSIERFEFAGQWQVPCLNALMCRLCTCKPAKETSSCHSPTDHRFPGTTDE